MDQNSLIKDIGRSYIVSSLLPAGFFISLGYLLYKDFFPLDLINNIVKDPISAGQWVLLFTLVFWVAFALYTSANWTFKLYEGYYFPRWLTWLLNKLFVYQRFERQMKNISDFNKMKDQNLEISQLTFDQRKIVRLANADYINVELITPTKKEYILPTRLGNVLKASELYPEERFFMQGLIFWPRLLPSLPPSMTGQLEEKNNGLTFLLNSSLLSYINGFLGLLIWVGSKIFYIWPNILLFLQRHEVDHLVMNGFTVFSANEYFVVCITWFVAGYVFYRLSIPVAETYGLLVRSSFDLYRFELLKQLNQPIPRSLSQERKLWAKLSDFIITAGQLQLKPVPIDIDYEIRNELLTNPRPRRKSAKKKKS